VHHKKKPLLSWSGQSSPGNSSLKQMGQLHLQKLVSTLRAATWQILGVDADWDDESGQVEVRIEAQVDYSGSNKSAFINGFAFHVTILAAVAAA
jgi:hypothetical protein